MGGKLSYPHQDIPEDRTFLITGGNTGIGYQTAKSIAKLGGKVVIACRNEEKAKEAIEKMQKEHQEEVKKKRADEKAAAAKEKEKADKAAAAKAAAEKKKSSASNKPEEKKEADAKTDAPKEGEADAKTDPPKEGEAADAPKEDAAKEDAPKEDAPKEETPKEDAPKEDAPKNTPAENAVNEQAPKEEEKTTSDGAAAAEAKPDGEVTEEKKEEEEKEEPIPPLNVEFMVLDLESFESTMKFVDAYKAKGYPLHVLICNAGYGAGSKETTGDGYEKHFQVNYLSHFLMTLHLLPLLRQSAPNSRIINVSSTLHTSGVFNLDNMNGEQSYDRIKFYGNSKLYQIMNTYAFERRLKDTGISVFSVHPGYVDSDFHKGAADSKLYSFMDSIAGTFRMKRNVQDGAMTSLVAALDSNLDGKTGLYFKNCKPANSSAASKKVESQEALWKFSVDILKEKNLINDDLLKDLTLPEPEPTGESKPEEETKPESDAAAGGDAAKTEEEKKPEDTTEEKKEEEKKEEGAGDAPTEEKKEEQTEEKKDEETEKKE